MSDDNMNSGREGNADREDRSGEPKVTEVNVKQPSTEDVAKWTQAIAQIMKEHPELTEAQANAGLVSVLLSPEVQTKIKQLDVELWTEVIRDLQARFPQWTEQEANDNLINLLSWYNS